MFSYQHEIREDLIAKVSRLEAKVQQQQLRLNALQKKQSVSVSETDLKKESRVSNGMPTSCADLNDMGHTFNGFYSVKGTSIMESVFCDFTKQPNDPGKYFKFKQHFECNF